MLFNSLPFFIFLPAVIGLYYLIPFKFRWLLLFVASCYFYMMAYPPYILILFAVIIIDYTCGLLMERKQGFQRKLFLLLSIIGNIGLLGYFKYSNFFIHTWIDFAALEHFKTTLQVRDILLPIGLSFHTFQSLSYTIEVYRGNQKAERHIGYFANYVLFFPQMVAGPIERYDRLGVQLRENHPYRYENISEGFKMVLYGLFVKMCIADNMAPIVNQVYAHPENFSHLAVITALLAFSIQIYADFYGYSTIALGAAKMMGIHLMDNFKQPYFSVSIREFWKRWHISLSSWFRDYVFIPMGGSRVNLFRLIINILFVFALSGFWHGANYTFIIWGLLHGLLYLIEFGFNKIPGVEKITANRIVRYFLGLKTFVVVTLIWIFFRAENMTQAKSVFQAIYKTTSLEHVPLTFNVFIWIPLLIFFLVEVLIRNKRIDCWLNIKPVSFRWSYYFALMLTILLFSGIKSYPFIYFKF